MHHDHKERSPGALAHQGREEQRHQHTVRRDVDGYTRSRRRRATTEFPPARHRRAFFAAAKRSAAPPLHRRGGIDASRVRRR